MNWKELLCLLHIVILLPGCDKEEAEVSGHLDGKKILSIHADQEGTLWFGSEKGLSAFTGSKWRNYSGEFGLPEGIRDICSRQGSSGGEILLASPEGAGILENERGEIRSADMLLCSNSGIAGDQVNAVMHDHKNSSWFGTDQGISVFHQGRWLENREDVHHKNYRITALAAGPDTISFVCLSGLGVALMQADVDAVTTVTMYQWPFSPFPSDNIQAIYVDGYRHQWIGTDKGLAFHGNFDPKKEWELYFEEDGLINNNVLSIQGDGQGNTWIGTVSGVSCFDGDEWKSYTREDGLAGDSVYSIALAGDGAIWFGTDQGASRFDGHSWQTHGEFKLPD